ncbi:hypothetical protein EC973_000387 [Apophysomyces ossiformis]|uniref:Mitochondrial adapter protein MCP1 transmembrane domain-containing protein n=1 Tax=Apophysomyces ossiformis TaxID=679940 RepID=A0A8H7BRP8_9FUNG|nr:hypothetical protein EC973_000387 [Apophysomyces ossiformis]
MPATDSNRPATSTSRIKLYNALNFIQSASALTFSTFAVIHGAQIAAAAVYGVDVADRWLLLGRPFYQDQHLESILVTGSVAVHIVSSIAKKSLGHKSSTTVVLPFHSGTGVALIPLTTLHYLLARTLPAKHFGDSAFVDFGHIAWGLQNWPILTYGLHSALIGASAYHIISGTSIAIQRVFGRSRKNEQGDPLKKNQLESFKQRSIVPIKPVVVGVISLFLLGGLIVVGQTKKIPLRKEYAQIYQMWIPLWRS